MARYSWGIMVLPLLYFAWQILKIAYKDQKDNPTPPCGFRKFMGLGFDQSLSPVWKVNFILLAVLIVGIIISLLFTPASQINH